MDGFSRLNDFSQENVWIQLYVESLKDNVVEIPISEWIHRFYRNIQ